MLYWVPASHWRMSAFRPSSFSTPRSGETMQPMENSEFMHLISEFLPNGHHQVYLVYLTPPQKKKTLILWKRGYLFSLFSIFKSHPNVGMNIKKKMYTNLPPFQVVCLQGLFRKQTAHPVFVCLLHRALELADLAWFRRPRWYHQALQRPPTPWPNGWGIMGIMGISAGDDQPNFQGISFAVFEVG